MEGILKSPNEGGPIKRHEIDQERLRYLGTFQVIIFHKEKKCQTLVQNFENLDTKTQNRINEAMASINIRMTKKDLENTEFEILDKMDDVKEELTKKIDGKL